MNKSAGWFLATLFGFLVLSFLGMMGLMYVNNFTSVEIREKGPKVGIVEVIGVIQDSKKVIAALSDFSKDPSIKAIVVRVDSPGGSVAPSQEIFYEMKKIREKKKIVVSMGNLAASGGYYIALGGNKIVANPGTITGSIGVISTVPNFRELAKFLKVDYRVIKSGPYKDTGSPLKEFDQKDEELFTSIVQNIYEQFLQDVIAERNIPREQLAHLADGRVLTGKQAHESKLVDELGNLQVAMQISLDLSDVKGEPIAVYPKKDKSSLLLDILMADDVEELASKIPILSNFF